MSVPGLSHWYFIEWTNYVWRHSSPSNARNESMIIIRYFRSKERLTCSRQLYIELTRLKVHVHVATWVNIECGILWVPMNRHQRPGQVHATDVCIYLLSAYMWISWREWWPMAFPYRIYAKKHFHFLRLITICNNKHTHASRVHSALRSRLCSHRVTPSQYLPRISHLSPSCYLLMCSDVLSQPECA